MKKLLILPLLTLNSLMGMQQQRPLPRVITTQEQPANDAPDGLIPPLHPSRRIFTPRNMLIAATAGGCCSMEKSSCHRYWHTTFACAYCTYYRNPM